MKNRSYLFFIFVFMILKWQVCHAQQQVQITTANPGNWMAATTPGINVNPPNLNGLNFNIAPASWIQLCGNPPNNTPAPYITIPGGCNQQGNSTTTYYTTNFNLAANPISYCMTGQIRADDGFRLYINGTRVGGNLNLCGANFLNGNNWQNIYNFNTAQLQPLMVIGQNTMTIEVANCFGPTFMAALFNMFTFTPGFSPIHYSISQAAGGYTTSLWGATSAQMKMMGFGGNGFWNATWLIESSANQNGPWTTFATIQENTSTQTAPWIPPVFSYGTYYRVSYGISTSCGALGIYQANIYIACPGCLIAADQTNNSPDQLIYSKFPKAALQSAETSSEDSIGEDMSLNMWVDTSNTTDISAKDIIKSASVDDNSQTLTIVMADETDQHLQIYSMIGKLMWMDQTRDQLLKIDIGEWPPGVYVIHISNESQRNIPQIKKVVIHR